MIIENGILKQWAPTKKITIGNIIKRKWESQINRDIVIPKGVKVIGGLKIEKDRGRFNQDCFYHPFGHNVDVETVSMDDSVEVIGDKAFEHCNNLKSIRLSKNIKKIGLNAFLGCESLTEIFIPASVEKIHEWAFSYCPNLVINCDELTIAEEYAKKNNLKYSLKRKAVII
jgi:hypothetical protein